MRIAVVVDGLEATRQINADAGVTIENAARKAMIGHPNFRVEIFRDEQVELLLSNLKNSNISAVIFASNSLRWPEGKVVQSLKNEKYQKSLHDFLEIGGGLAILHQYSPSPNFLPLPIHLPKGYKVRYDLIDSYIKVGPIVIDPNSTETDSLFNFPFPVDKIDLSNEGQLATKIAWMAIHTDSETNKWLQPIVRSSNKEVLIAKSSDTDKWRMVVSSIPLDWHRSEEMLANIIRFIVGGELKTIIWPSEFTNSNLDLIESLNQAMSTHRRDSELSTSERDLEFGNTDINHWLFSRPALHLIPNLESLTDPESEKKKAKITQSGGLLLQVDKSQNHLHTYFSGVVGDRRKEFGSEFGRTYSALNAGAPKTTDPWPLRNMIIGAKYFSKEMNPSELYWNPTINLEFRRSLSRLLSKKDITLTTLFAITQIYASMGVSKKLMKQTIEAINGLSAKRKGDLALEAAVSVAFGYRPFNYFLEAVQILFDSETNVVDSEMNAVLALRLLDWIGFLHFIVGKGPELNDEVSRQKLNLYGLKLLVKAQESENSGVWQSDEGTSNAILGACAIFAITGERKALEIVIGGMMSLRSAHRKKSGKSEDAPIECRILYCLAVVERFAPLVLDQIQTRIGAVDPHFSSSTNNGTSDLDRNTMDGLANVNKKLEEELLIRRKQKPALIFGIVGWWSLYVTGLFFAVLEIGRFFANASGLTVLLGGSVIGIIFLNISLLLLGLMENIHIVPTSIQKLLRVSPRFERLLPLFSFLPHFQLPKKLIKFARKSFYLLRH